jgi:hypothetical protein
MIIFDFIDWLIEEILWLWYAISSGILLAYKIWKERKK